MAQGLFFPSKEVTSDDLGVLLLFEFLLHGNELDILEDDFQDFALLCLDGDEALSGEELEVH